MGAPGGIWYGGNDENGGNSGGGSGIHFTPSYTLLKVETTLCDSNLDDDAWTLHLTGRHTEGGFMNVCTTPAPILTNADDVTKVARRTMYFPIGYTQKFTLTRSPLNQHGGTDEYKVSFDATDILPGLPQGSGWVWHARSDNSPLEDALPYINGLPPDPSGLKWEYDAGRIDFITPKGNPLNIPEMRDSGDGQNQFTYSTANPGVLTLNLKVKVKPASLAVKIAEHCRFKVDPVGDSYKEWSSVNQDGQPMADFNGWLTAMVTFTGLPASNAAFGWKTAVLELNGLAIASNRYGVFFPRNFGNRSPAFGLPEESLIPNWFYYWKEGGVCGIPPNCIFDTTSADGYGGVSFDPPVIGLGWLACEQMTIRTYYPRLGVAFLPGHLSFPPVTVGSGAKGIECVAEIVQHEQKHLDNYWQYRSTPLFQALHFDGDDDRMPDWLELGKAMGIHSATNHPDTYNLELNLHPAYAEYGDEELRCRIHQTHLTLPIFPEKDWANPGCQHKDQWGPKVGQ